MSTNQANPFAIGVFVIGAVVLAITGLLIFGSGKLFKHTTRAVCFFTGDVMGLNVGAPVKFKGVDIGTVAEVRLRIPEETETVTETAKAGARMPVIIEIDNDQVTNMGATKPLDTERLKQLIALGLRAKLVSQSLVTGMLLVQLDFHADAAPTYVLPLDSKMIEIPTVPTGMQEIQAAAQSLIRRLEHVDLERLVTSITGAVDNVARLAGSPKLQQAVDGLPGTVENVNGAVTNLRQLLGNIDREQAPLLQSLRATSDRTAVALGSVQTLIAPNAPLVVDIAASLRELAAAAHSVRLLADSLDRNPSAIVRGTEASAK